MSELQPTHTHDVILNTSKFYLFKFLILFFNTFSILRSLTQYLWNNTSYSKSKYLRRIHHYVLFNFKCTKYYNLCDFLFTSSSTSSKTDMHILSYLLNPYYSITHYHIVALPWNPKILTLTIVEIFIYQPITNYSKHKVVPP